MNRWLISLIIGASLSAGCAVTPPDSPWDSLTVETGAATPAVDCGSFPMPTEATDTQFVYDQDGANALEQYRICSEANEGNVDEHAAQIMQLKIGRKGLTEAGAAQRRIADMYKQMMEEERRHHFWQSIGLYALVAGSILL